MHNRGLCGHRQVGTLLTMDIIMGMKKINKIRSKNWLILKWLYLWNRLTDFDALTFGRKLLMSTFIVAGRRLARREIG